MGYRKTYFTKRGERVRSGVSITPFLLFQPDQEKRGFNTPSLLRVKGDNFRENVDKSARGGGGDHIKC